MPAFLRRQGTAAAWLRPAVMQQFTVALEFCPHIPRLQGQLLMIGQGAIVCRDLLHIVSKHVRAWLFKKRTKIINRAFDSFDFFWLCKFGDRIIPSLIFYSFKPVSKNENDKKIKSTNWYWRNFFLIIKKVKKNIILIYCL